MQAVFRSPLAYLCIFVIALLIRLYHLPQLMVFTGEQGRDLLVAADILRGHFTLLGTSASFSDVHFGPFYHYFNAFFLLLSAGHPLGPTLGYVLLSAVIAVILADTCRRCGYPLGGIFTGVLVSVSPMMIEIGWQIFNSSLVILFISLSLWCYSRVKQKLNPSLVIVAGISASLAVQTNYICIGSVLVIFLLFLTFIKRLPILFLGGLLIAALPYFAFELRHNFFNTRALIMMFSQYNDIGLTLRDRLSNLLEVLSLSVSNATNLRFPGIFNLVGLGLLTGIVIYISRRHLKPLLLLWGTVIIGALIISLFRGPFRIHYLNGLYPLVFLICGLIVDGIIKYKWLMSIYVVITLLIAILGWNYSCRFGCPMPIGWTLKGVETAANIIGRETSGKYNVASIIDGDTRAQPLRYLLRNNIPLPMDVYSYTSTDKLFVIAHTKQGNVLEYPVWEIGTFLPATISGIWNIQNGYNVYELTKI